MAHRLRALSIAVVALAATAAMWVWVAEPMRVPSDSMLPTLVAGDHVVVAKQTSVGRGDLVVFHRSDGLLLKRVVAVSGDRVGIEDGILLVNGRSVDEAYVDQSTVDGLYFGPMTVGAGRLFVLGDNRAESVDSRDFGAIRTADVVGEVVLRLWPSPSLL